MLKLIKYSERIVLLSCVIYWIISADSYAPFLTTMAILVHEFGHILVSGYLSSELKEIKTEGTGLRLVGKAYPSYRTEALIALGGPLFNLISAILTYLTIGNNYFVEISLSLALLNLLPIRSFDGSKIADAILVRLLPWRMSEIITGALSFVFLFSIWCTSIYVIIKSGKNVIPLLFSALIFIKIITNSEKL